MAAVITTVLARRRARKAMEEATASGAPPTYTADHPFADEAGRYVQPLRPTATASSMSTGSGGSREDHAATDIQRVFRSYFVRQSCRGEMLQRLSGHAVSVCLEQVAQYHYGWSRLCVHLVVFLMYWVTVALEYVVVYPLASDTNLALEAKLSTIQGLAPVTSPTHAMQYLDTVASNLYFGDKDVNFTAGCMNLYTDLCNHNLAPYNNTLSVIVNKIVATCPGPTNTSGYVDASNRIVAMVVTQTRRKRVACAADVVDVNPFMAIPETPCYSEQETDEFVSPVCSGNPGLCQTDSVFRYNHDRGAFVFVLNLGTLNIPFEYTKCRMNRLRQFHWVDESTKSMCATLTTFNKQGNGRYANVAGCFDFLPGGRVDYTTSPHSSLVTSGSYAATGMGITVMVLCALEFWVYVLLFYRRLFPKDTRRSKCDCSCGLVTSALELIFIFLAIIVYERWDAMYASGVPVPERHLPNDTHPFLVSRKTVLNDTDVQLELFEFMQGAINLFMTAKLFSALAFGVLLWKTIILIGFHPTIGFLSSILKRSWPRLCTFFLVFFLVVLCYAFVGIILIGTYNAEFATLGPAINRLLLASVGELQDFSFIAFPKVPRYSFQEIIIGLYFWSYVATNTIILMSVLLSIIVEAFVAMFDTTDDALLTLMQTFVISCRFWWGLARYYWREGCCFAGWRWCGYRPAAMSRRNLPVHRRSPLQQLHKFQLGKEQRGCTSREARTFLTGLLNHSVAVEKIIQRMRQKTQEERLYVHRARCVNLQPNSDEILAYQLSLTERTLQHSKRLHRIPKPPSGGVDVDVSVDPASNPELLAANGDSKVPSTASVSPASPSTGIT